MKSPYFTEDHEIFRQAVRQFVEKELIPYADQWEKEEKIDRALFRKLGEQGYLGINHDEAYGGNPVDIFYSVAYLEELAKAGYAGTTAAVAVHQYMAVNHIAHAANHELKEKYLRPSIEGKLVGAIAISEPGAGSDVSSLRTTAVRDGDHYVINGSKTFITNGHYCDFVVVSCKTDPNAGVNGISLIVVDRGTPGFTSTQLKKIGLHSSDTAELAFDNVRVPVSNRVGQENMGFFYIMESFQIERLVAGIMNVGGMEKCIEMTLKYMNERETFGRKINKYQVLRHEIAELCTEIEAAKQMTYHTCWQYENGDMPVKECSMVKLYTSELANKVIDRCLQMFGGYGYMEEYPIARAYRDARVGTIVGGTSQIMREIIAKMVIDDVRYKKVYDNPEAAPKAVETASANGWGNPQTAKEIIESIPKRFKSEKANGTNTVFHFDISGENACKYTVNIQSGQCSVAEGLQGTADCTIAADSKVYEDVELGRSDPQTAVMSGQLKVSNLGAMMGFVRLFKRLG